MKYWKNTTTLDAYTPELKTTVLPAEAELAVLGGKAIELDRFPRLRGLFKCGVGTDNVPFEECRRRGIVVGLPSAGTAAVIFEETANFACHLIFSQLYADAGQLETWSKMDRPPLSRRRVLVVGLGNIGRRVADKLRNWVTVTTFDTMVNRSDELRGLMGEADVVSLHIPLMPATTEWIDAEKLGWMKTGAALVNTARGPLVREDDLLREIESGRLRAAFDVFWEEPYHGPLRQFHPQRFQMSPHVASTCDEFLRSLAGDLHQFSITLAS